MMSEWPDRMTTVTTTVAAARRGRGIPGVRFVRDRASVGSRTIAIVIRCDRIEITG